MTPSTPSKIPRLTGWLLVVVMLLPVIGLLTPHQFLVVIYKIFLLTLGIVFAYWVDRALFSYDRPHTYLDTGEDLMHAATRLGCHRIRAWPNIGALMICNSGHPLI